MREDKGELYFDLNHTNMFKYHHLGEDIGSREAARATTDLQKLISAVLSCSIPDSPVYTYLPTLQQPILTPMEYETLLERAEDHQNQLVGHTQAGERALMESRHGDAVREFTAAEKIKPLDPYIIQKLALATYKSEQPSRHSALIDGLMIIEMLKPGQSNDPETLGITGAIRKRLWEITEDNCQLDAAIHFYSRGFEIRQDYYNGENLALCLDHRAKTQISADEKMFDRMSARKTRETILNILSDILLSPSFQDRSDKKWIYATFANCSFALGNNEEGDIHEALFLEENPAKWEITTYEEGKSALLNLLS
jgi:tetratricopeptide (TPR) repeat protein